MYGPSDFHQPSGRALRPHSSWESEAQPEGSVRGIESKGDRIRRACWFAAAPGRNLLWRRSGVTRRPLIIAGRHLQNLAGPTATVHTTDAHRLRDWRSNRELSCGPFPSRWGGALTLTSYRKSLGHYTRYHSQSNSTHHAVSALGRLDIGHLARTARGVRIDCLAHSL